MMRIRSRGTSGALRSIVSAIIGRGPASGRSCLGREGVETGQNREPIPPARITAQSGGSVREDLVDPRKEFLGAERLGEEVRGSEPDRLLAIRLLSLGR